MTEEQSCEEQVFPLAVNLLDRFLALEASVLQRCQLQLLGCVCLLTASKLRQCRPIGVDLLVYYTDYSVTSAQIRVSNVLLLLSILGIVFFIICWFCKLIFMTWYSFLKNLCGPTIFHILSDNKKCPRVVIFTSWETFFCSILNTFCLLVNEWKEERL